MSFIAENGRIQIRKPNGFLTFDSNAPMLLPLQRFIGSIVVPGRSGSSGAVNQTLNFLIASNVRPETACVLGVIRGTNSVFSVDWLNLNGSAVYYSYWQNNQTAPNAELGLSSRIDGANLYLDVKITATYTWQYPANTIEYKLVGCGFAA